MTLPLYSLIPFLLLFLSSVNSTPLTVPHPTVPTASYRALLLHFEGVASLVAEVTVADSIAQSLAGSYNNAGEHRHS